MDSIIKSHNLSEINTAACMCSYVGVKVLYYNTISILDIQYHFTIKNYFLPITLSKQVWSHFVQLHTDIHTCMTMMSMSYNKHTELVALQFMLTSISLYSKYIHTSIIWITYHAHTWTRSIQIILIKLHTLD